MNNVSPYTVPDNGNAQSRSALSGRTIVLGMFAFALTMIILLFTYWHFYTAPFRELQYAIATEFENSSPRVVGGQHKSHKSGLPKVLRVVVYVPDDDFDPEVAEVEREERANQLARLAFVHHDLSRYDEMQIVLLQRVAEQATRRWNVMQPIDDWRQQLEMDSLIL